MTALEQYETSFVAASLGPAGLKLLINRPSIEYLVKSAKSGPPIHKFFDIFSLPIYLKTIHITNGVHSCRDCQYLHLCSDTLNP